MWILGLPYIVISIRWCICIKYCFAYDPLNPVDPLSKTLKGLFNAQKQYFSANLWFLCYYLLIISK
jgi:hypothetical protein